MEVSLGLCAPIEKVECVSHVLPQMGVFPQLEPEVICTMPWNLLDCPLTGQAFIGGKGMPLLINARLYLVQVGLKPICYHCLFFYQRSVKQLCRWYLKYSHLWAMCVLTRLGRASSSTLMNSSTFSGLCVIYDAMSAFFLGITEIIW